MNRIAAALAIAALPLAGSAAGAAPDAVDRYVTGFIAEKHIPGLSIAVVRDGKLVKAAGYGFANLELKVPATADSAYEIGSITKSFTAQAIMLLVEEGKLGIDDTLGKHLDGLPPAWRPLTIRQLLTHTSGLKDWEGDGLLSFRREYTPAEFIALLSPYPLDFAPGEHWAYTNTSYPLLGQVIAAASGQPFDEFVSGRIFAPLGMRQACFSRPQDIVPNRASGYVDENGRLRKGELLRPRLVEPNGGILASVRELARWERSFHAGGLLSQASLDAMWMPAHTNNGEAVPSGLGFFVADVHGHRAIVHNGITPAGFSSVFYHYPDDRISVFALCNIDRGDAINRVATHVAASYVRGLSIEDD